MLRDGLFLRNSISKVPKSTLKFVASQSILDFLIRLLEKWLGRRKQVDQTETATILCDDRSIGESRSGGIQDAY